jgi:peroxiredoxin
VLGPLAARHAIGSSTHLGVRRGDAVNRRILLVAILGAVGLWVWRAELFTISRPGQAPLPLVIAEQRTPVAFDVVLPAVPVGMERLRGGDSVLLIHYWAPWEHDSRAQAAALDSLRRLPELERMRVAVVCFDPFPSVTRYVARQRLRLAVLLDGDHELRRALPCPSVPYTYVIDRSGRIAIAQPGEVDWWSPRTIAALRRVIEVPATPPPAVL